MIGRLGGVQPTARTMLWQRSILSLCGFGLVLLGVFVWGEFQWVGDLGVTAIPSGKPFVDRVDNIRAHSPADLHGVRVGDLVDIRDLSPPDRYRWRTNPLVGERLLLPIQRDGRRFPVLLTARQVPRKWDLYALGYVGPLGAALALFFSGLLAWRRPENAEVRVLSPVLILIVIGQIFSSGVWATPWAALDATLDILGQCVVNLGVVLLAAYAMLFGKPSSLVRRGLTGFTYAATAFVSIVNAVGLIGEWNGSIDPASWAFRWVLGIGPFLLSLLCAALAVRDSEAEERPRLIWATGSLGVLYAGYIVFNGILALAPQYTAGPVPELLFNLTYFLAPIGLTYSLLTRRLLDVGFVLNRAAVFTVVSLVVVGTFILAEWALGGWLHSANRVTNVAVSAALALALGLSLHPIHAWVDRVVDRVFFRKRHEAERALLQFAHEATFVTDGDVVLDRAARTLEDHADSSSVTFALYDGASRYGGIDENDAALVRLRAVRDVVDLHTVDTVLRGEFAYPMLARGRLVGALVLGPKRSGEPYAPDESHAIAQLAHGVGVALDLLSVGRDHSNNVVLDAITALRGDIAELRRDRTAL